MLLILRAQQVLDYWTLHELGEMGAVAPAGLARRSPSIGPTITQQAHRFVERLERYEEIRPCLVSLLLDGDASPQEKRAAAWWIVRTLIPAVGEGLAVLPPPAAERLDQKTLDRLDDERKERAREQRVTQRRLVREERARREAEAA